MNAKMIIAGLLGTTMLSTMAVAQTPAPSTSPSSSSVSQSGMQSMSHKGQWRSSKLIGLNIYNANNENLGEINELLVDQSGKIQAAVIGVGGFLGMGERNVAIPFDRLQWSNEPGRNVSVSNARSGSSGMAPSGTGSSTTTGSASSGAAGSSSSSTTSASRDQWYPDHGILNVSKDELKAMPEFKYST